MRTRTFVGASIYPGKFTKGQTHWPTEEGWSAKVETAIEEISSDGSRLYINEDLCFQHYDFSKCWEWVAKVKLECNGGKQ